MQSKFAFSTGVNLVVIAALVCFGALMVSNVATAQVIGNPNNDFVLDNRDLVLRDGNHRVRIRLDAQSGDIRILNSDGDTIAVIEANGNNFRIGGQGNGGDVVLLPGRTQTQVLENASMHLDGDTGTAFIGGGGANGQLVLRNQQGEQTILAQGSSANLVLGLNGEDGDVFVRTGAGQPTVHIDGDTGEISAGGNGQDGAIHLQDAGEQVVIRLDSSTGTLRLGGNGESGNLTVTNNNNQTILEVEGDNGNVRIGGSGQDGDLLIFDNGGQTTLTLDGNSGAINAGGNGQHGEIVVSNADSEVLITLDGESGILRAGLLHSTQDGILFPDGTTQATAQLRGPRGPEGPQGPPGPPVTTVAMCQDGTAQAAAPTCGFICTGTVVGHMQSPCTITSDTGTCSAGSFIQGALIHTGSCCVCGP